MDKKILFEALNTWQNIQKNLDSIKRRFPVGSRLF